MRRAALLLLLLLLTSASWAQTPDASPQPSPQVDTLQLRAGAAIPDHTATNPSNEPMLSFRLTSGNEGVQVNTLTVRDKTVGFAAVKQAHLYNDPNGSGRVDAQATLLSTATPKSGKITFEQNPIIMKPLASQNLLVTYVLTTPSTPSPSPAAMLPLALLLLGLRRRPRQALAALVVCAGLSVACGGQGAGVQPEGSVVAPSGPGTLQATLAPADILAVGQTSASILTVGGPTVNGANVTF